VAVLKLRRQEQDTDGKHSGDGRGESGLAFTMRHCTPNELPTFTEFDRRISKAGVRRITVHGTRKSCGSLLAALDVHPAWSCRSCGTAKIGITIELHRGRVVGDARSIPDARRSARLLRPLLHIAAAASEGEAGSRIGIGL
jgi:hypothetical protein